MCATDEKYELIEVLGRKALYADHRIPHNIPGVYVYDIRGLDDEYFCTLEPNVVVNHSGSVIMKEPVNFDEGVIIFNEDTAPDFSDSRMCTVDEFMAMDTQDKKVGRPISKDPRRNTVKVRMTDEELLTLLKVSDALGESKSEVIRRALELYYKA